MRSFETTYQLEEWRKVESEHFDEDGDAYKSQVMSYGTQEQMLKLINQLDSELTDFEHNEKNIVEQMNQMCAESLPPDDFANWNKIKLSLKLVRKDLQL